MSVISDRMWWTHEMAPDGARALARDLFTLADAAGRFEASVHRAAETGPHETLDDALAGVGLSRSGSK